MILFGDRGVPDGFRFMHGYAGHTHKLVKANGDFVYAQVRRSSPFLAEPRSLSGDAVPLPLRPGHQVASSGRRDEARWREPRLRSAGSLRGDRTEGVPQLDS